jgi:predicted  nucleic acid-binding Zn-ribbon protein
MSGGEVDELLAELRRLGQRRTSARREAAELTDRMERLVQQAHAAGVTISELERVTGVTRLTLSRMVRGEKRWRSG